MERENKLYLRAYFTYFVNVHTENSVGEAEYATEIKRARARRRQKRKAQYLFIQFRSLAMCFSVLFAS